MMPCWEAESKVLAPLGVASWKRIQTLTGSDKVTRRSVSAGVIIRGGHCLKVWTKKKQVVSLSSAESELYAGSQHCIRRAWGPERGKGLGDIVWSESAPGCFSNNVLGQQQRTGQNEARRHAESVDTSGILTTAETEN